LLAVWGGRGWRGWRGGRLWFVVTLLAVAGVGAWAIRANPTPRVDVFYYQYDGAEELLAGRNPYEMTFANPYEPAENWVFAEGSVSDERIEFGFPYMPVSLLMVLPGQALGDYRYAHLAFVLLAAAGLAVLGGRQGGVGVLAGVVLVTHPRMTWAIEWGWTEPVLMVLLVGTLLLARRRPGWAWVLAGLMMFGKQYMLLLLPLLRLLPRHRLLAIGLGMAVTMPMVAWSWGAFAESALWLQFRQPFRADALSFLALANNVWGVRWPDWMSVGVAFVLSCVLAAKLPRTAWGLSAGFAVVLPVLFVLSKQAFANYYLLVSVAWLAWLVVEGEEVEPPMNADERR
jgi:hypothetical protein